MCENRAAPAEPCMDLPEARRRLVWLEYEAHLINRTLARLDVPLVAPDVTLVAPDVPRAVAAKIVDPIATAAVARQPAPAGRQLTDAVTLDRAAPSPRERCPGVTGPDTTGLTITTVRPHGRSRSLARRRRPGRRRRLPSWCVSLTAHAALLMLLGVLTVAAIPADRPMLEASLLDTLDDRLEELGDVQIEPVESDAAWAEQAAPEAPPAPALAPIDPLEPAWELPSQPDGELAERLGEPASRGPVSAAGDPREARRLDRLEADTTSFFGTRARADRIVFLVDNSNSMDEGRFETALLEIGRSVERLSAKQSFSVIFYSDAVYPMFHPDPAADLVPATRENKQRLFAWLRGVPMCMGGQLVGAVKAAERLEPQVIFLLSDGVMGDFSLQYLTAPKPAAAVIHTLGMTVPDMTAARRLAAIALANGGTFRPVGVTPMARRLAVARPIAKLRVRGPVWGRRLPKVTAGR